MKQWPSPAIWLCALVFACGQKPGGPTSGGAAGPGDERASQSTPIDGSGEPFVVDEAWERAKGGDEEELARLARVKGLDALVAGLDAPAKTGARPTAIRALAHAPGFAQIVQLARIAEEGSDEDADLALQSAHAIAARARTAEEVEDAAELREGCEILLRLAKNASAPRKRRILALGTLRMFADRGVVATAELPPDP
jgi:hypothetical protein